MKTLIIYDSFYGNTEKVAKTIGTSLKSTVLPVEKVSPSDLNTYDLLIVGSPTQGGRATPNMQKFLEKIPANALKNIYVATFDTRFSKKDHGIGLRILMEIISFAASRIANSLKEKGGRELIPPEGFIVTNKEGPLGKGELERAARWAKTISMRLQS